MMLVFTDNQSKAEKGKSRKMEEIGKRQERENLDISKRSCK